MFTWTHARVEHAKPGFVVRELMFETTLKYTIHQRE